MEKGKHTPGPWIINPPGEWPLGELRIMSETFGRVASVGVPASDKEGGRANARLIAAAPDLLLALNKAKSIVGSFAASATSGALRDARTKVYQEILAAIAKAEGRE